MAINYSTVFDISELIGSGIIAWFDSTPDGDIYIDLYHTGYPYYYALDDYETNSSYLYHFVDMTAVQDYQGDVPYDTSEYASASFPALLQTTINAATTARGWSNPIIVTWDPVTAKFTFSCASAGFRVLFEGTAVAIRNLLGFAQNNEGVASASITSTQPCTYNVVSDINGMSKVSDEYEPSGIASLAISDGGKHFGMSRTKSPIYHDWEQRFEPIEKVFKRNSVDPLPWSYQHLFEQCRTVYPFTVCTEQYRTGYYPVYFFREDGAHFKPMRDHPDYDGHWHIPFRTSLAGWVAAP